MARKTKQRTNRQFDNGKRSYARCNRNSRKQETRHLLSKEVMPLSGVQPENYKAIAFKNYRMGSKGTNVRDKKFDNALVKSATKGTPFPTRELKKGKHSMNRAQQLSRARCRAKVAKEGWLATGDPGFAKMLVHSVQIISSLSLRCPSVCPSCRA